MGPLGRSVDLHVLGELGGYTGRLHHAHTFVVGIDRTGIAIEGRFTLQHQHGETALAEQVGEGGAGRAEAGNDHVNELVVVVVAVHFECDSCSGEYSGESSERKPRPKLPRLVESLFQVPVFSGL
ncbi:hypothetical protein D9M68_764950 [compost metagenome]